MHRVCGKFLLACLRSLQILSYFVDLLITRIRLYPLGLGRGPSPLVANFALFLQLFIALHCSLFQEQRMKRMSLPANLNMLPEVARRQQQQQLKPVSPFNSQSRRERRTSLVSTMLLHICCYILGCYSLSLGFDTYTTLFFIRNKLSPFSLDVS